MDVNKFSAMQLGLASPERIHQWSHGEVKKPETINYRSQKPERDGLFCERIFGPSKDWECACGKYKKVRYQGLVCDKCGVEITTKDVRRERMGHIDLAAPVAHIWYLRGIPSRMGLVLNIPPKQLEEVVYFVSWIVIDPGQSGLAYKQVISEREFRENTALYGKDGFVAKTGAEAVKTLLEQVDLKAEKAAVDKELENASGDKRKKLIKRLETLNAFIESDNKPEWMVLTTIPVIPPDLRPMLALDGGRFATSDLNDLYRRVITRNNRLKKLLELGTPSIIVQNEKRMLQEAVDALIDNGRRSKPVTGTGGRPLKSLSNALKGKQGRFRQNLLGKRVDYSGRSVIAVGPDLKMYQCGLPREMAMELFKPFVIHEIVNHKYASEKAAEKLIATKDPRAMDMLEKVVENHPVLLNRAPTLHRLGIQAFMPKLVEGRAIRLHPLVCPGFNADFDGDQMAVHVPLSEEARAEAEVLMLGSNNILGPKDGKPIVTPGQDMVMGNFYLNMEETQEEFFAKANKYMEKGEEELAKQWHRYGENEGHVFYDYDEAILAYQQNLVHLHTRVAVVAKNLHKDDFDEQQNSQYLITTIGKLIFNSIFPSDFPYVNEVSEDNLKQTPHDDFVPFGTDIAKVIKDRPVHGELKKKDLGKVIAEVFKRYGTDGSSDILDGIKDLGFQYSTVAGITISLSDITVAPNKQKYVDHGREMSDKLKELLNRGHLTMPEWEKHFSKLWDDIKGDIGGEIMHSLDRMNPINMMAVSGARGNQSHFTQMAGIRGLMARPTQSKSKKEYQPSIIEVPIYSCFREGLNVSEFFISTHGVRKGLTDTALKTAESGYLTRRLVDAAQDVVITEDDCGTDEGYLVSDIIDPKNNTVIESLYDRLLGRYAFDDIVAPNGETIVHKDEFIDENLAKAVVDAGVKEAYIRSTFTCQCKTGICRKCYGRNMATGKLVEEGEAVGTMAAQAIGEPGTQLTMRTFHTGGVAGKDSEDITQGLPRVEELFEARNPKHQAVLSKIDGEITDIIEQENQTGFIVVVANANDRIEHKCDASTVVLKNLAVGSKVHAGDPLTEGQIAPKELLQLAGVAKAENYILTEVKKVYASQGIDISDKHIEVVIRQMLKKVIVTDAGGTGLTVGQSLSLTRINDINEQAFDEGKAPAQFVPMMLGISKASIETDSFLSAASFQETTRVLTDAAIHGKTDRLKGLKENVILGKLIPAGTGFQSTDGSVRESTIDVEELAQQLKEERDYENELAAAEDEKRLPKEVLAKKMRDMDPEEEGSDHEDGLETSVEVSNVVDGESETTNALETDHSDDGLTSQSDIQE